MLHRAKLLLTVVVFASAAPAAAQTSSPPSGFDGRYVGVSIEVSKSASKARGHCPAANGKPAPLVITDGIVRTAGKEWWEGTVSPQGAVVMHNPNSLRVDAQIDAEGTVRGQYSGPSCISTYVWRRQSG
jgi:hypothetical protein